MNSVDKILRFLILVVAAWLVMPYVHTFLQALLPFIGMLIGLLLVVKGTAGRGPWNWWR